MKKAFNMYVRTLIISEHGKILLLKRKTLNNKPIWELPGSIISDDESFDEVASASIKRETGYYIYPGKILGIGEYTDSQNKELHVIMDASIISGELILERNYDQYTWIAPSRLTDYPLAPWLEKYLKNNKIPFNDIQEELDELEKKDAMRKEIQEAELKSNNLEDNINTQEIGDSVKSSLSLLKDTIIRTFHPKEAKITRTTPKGTYGKQYGNPKSNTTDEDMIYINHSKDNENKKSQPVMDPITEKKQTTTTNNTEDIIIDHDDIASENNDKIIIKPNQEKVETEDIIIDHSENKTIQEKDIIIDHTENETPKKEESIYTKPKKVYEMNINKEHNQLKDTPITKQINPKVPDRNITKEYNQVNNLQTSTQNESDLIKPKKVHDLNINKEYNEKINTEEEFNKITPKKSPDVIVKKEQDEIPDIRKEKEDRERISFNTESVRKRGEEWKNKLNEINKTEANTKKVRAPHPKGKRRK